MLFSQKPLENGLHKNKEENQKKKTRELTQYKAGIFRLRWGVHPAAACERPILSGGHKAES